VTNTSRYSHRISLMKCWKLVGALVRPKGITRDSNKLYWVLNAIFHSSPSTILTRLYAPWISSLVKYLALCRHTSVSCSSGRG
jgi:hypothetical protein